MTQQKETQNRHALYILNGPNLNALGKRQPAVYGHVTLEQINRLCLDKAQSLGYDCVFRQTNHEGELVGWVHEAGTKAKGLIMNPAAYTHTSIALRDALLIAQLPYIEVHLSNIYARESFRHVSYTAPLALGVISGLGSQGYLFALESLALVLAQSKKAQT